MSRNSGKVVRLHRGAARSTSTGSPESPAWTKTQKQRVARALALILKQQEIRGRGISQEDAELAVRELVKGLHRRFSAAEALAAIEEHQYRSPHFPALADLARIIGEMREGADAAGGGELVFVAQTDALWPVLAARHVRERRPSIGRCPMMHDSRHDAYGWLFPAAWVEDARREMEGTGNERAS